MKKDKIEIDINTVENENIRNFIQSELSQCKKHKIKVELIKTPDDFNGNECSGHFGDDPNPTLVVQVTPNIYDWLPIFVHETCHKDQFIEKADVWTAKIGNQFDPLEIFDLWIDHHVELRKHQLRPVLEQIVQVELDCERRAVAKIQKYNLPINQTEYIQKSNSYIWYYHAAAHHRAYSQRTSPYANLELWSKMPVDFDNNYSTINSKMLKLFTKYCY
jgi:hypothetical protein